MAEEQLFYRFRTLKNIFEYKELENQEIYFAHFTELNDPMEAYSNIIFSSNKSIWNKFILLYFTYLDNSFLHILYKKIILKNSNLHVSDEKNNLLYYRIYKKYFKNNFVTILSNKIYNINQIKLIFTNFHVVFSLIMIYEYKDILDKRLHNNITCKELQNILNKFYKSIELSNDYNLLLYLENFFDRKIRDEYFYTFLYTIDNFFNALYNSISSYCSIACFNKNQNNTLMWSHYSENHTGVCLVFSLKNKQIELEGYYNNSSLILSLFGELEIKTQTHKLHKIKYQKIKNNVNFFDIVDNKIYDFIYRYDFNIKQTKYDNMTLGEYKKYISTLDNVLYKDTKWKYENEYRIVIKDINFRSMFFKTNKIDDTEYKSKYRYKFKNLYGIIFGLKTPISKKQQIINIIKNKCIKENRTDFKFYEMQIDENSGELKQVELNINLFDTTPTEQNNE